MFSMTTSLCKSISDFTIVLNTKIIQESKNKSIKRFVSAPYRPKLANWRRIYQVATKENFALQTVLHEAQKLFFSINQVQV